MESCIFGMVTTVDSQRWRSIIQKPVLSLVAVISFHKHRSTTTCTKNNVLHGRPQFLKLNYDYFPTIWLSVLWMMYCFCFVQVLHWREWIAFMVIVMDLLFWTTLCVMRLRITYCHVHTMAFWILAVITLKTQPSICGGRCTHNNIHQNVLYLWLQFLASLAQ